MTINGSVKLAGYRNYAVYVNDPRTNEHSFLEGYFEAKPNETLAEFKARHFPRINTDNYFVFYKTVQLNDKINAMGERITEDSSAVRFINSLGNGIKKANIYFDSQWELYRVKFFTRDKTRSSDDLETSSLDAAKKAAVDWSSEPVPEAWTKLTRVISEKFGGVKFRNLNIYDAQQLVNLQEADKLAKGKFWTMSEARMRAVINTHPELVICEEVTQTPWQILTMFARSSNVDTFNKLPKDTKAIFVDYKKIDADSTIKNFDKLSVQDQENVINLHPEFLNGPAASAYVAANVPSAYRITPEDMFKASRSSMGQGFTIGENFTDFDQWFNTVKLSNPGKADKLTVKLRMEGTKEIKSIIVPGEDKVYGTWDVASDRGVVLHEINNSPKETAKSTYFKKKLTSV